MDSLEKQLQRHGPVIGLQRDGRVCYCLGCPHSICSLKINQLEYIVSDEFTSWVLTDDLTFSFEYGIAKGSASTAKPRRFLANGLQILNIQFVPKLFGKSFFHDIDSVVNNLLTRHLDTMVHRGWSPFVTGMQLFVNSTDSLLYFWTTRSRTIGNPMWQPTIFASAHSENSCWGHGGSYIWKWKFFPS